MAKVFVRYSSCIFALVIFALLLVSVGLLVFVMKGQLQHHNSLSLDDGYIKVPPASPKRSTGTSSPQTALKSLDAQSTSEQTLTGRTTESSEVETSPWEHFRLPKYVIPSHYDLLLYPDLMNDTFTGNVNITVNVTRKTNVFVVHAHKLIIKDCSVFEYRTEAEIGVERSFTYEPHEYFIFEAEKTVEPGIYKVSYQFSGSLVGNIGFYKSWYNDPYNKTRYLTTSRFQPTYARRVFPCFDEPSFKSTFTVSIVHESGYRALSNMPVEGRKPYFDAELVVTKFQKSVPMVTYLACFIICDFDVTHITASSGKEFSIYLAPKQLDKTEHAMKFGIRVLEYFENYFGIDYPLTKLDMVDIPNFISSSQGQWGVTIFRETNLLFSRETSSSQNKQKISKDISHVMAHMWFGNLVTMEWWDDVWLIEGFASYVEYKGVHEQYPEWDILSQFVAEDIQPAMDLDSTMSSRPLVQSVTHPDEIAEIFEDISYKKGASILRMLESFVGQSKFQRGILQFLKKYQFSNANTADLWQELSEVCGHQGNRTIASVMKTWVEQKGFPIITVKRLRFSENESVFVAKQERYIKNEELYRQNWNSSKEYIWSVPLSYITEDKKTDVVWIHDKELEFVVPMVEKAWIKFNVNQTGYYLVNYEKEEWDKLINILMVNPNLLSPADRSNLLFDTFLLGEAGHIPFDVFLSMSLYLKNEADLIPWKTAYHCFVYLCQLLQYTEVNLLLKSYVRDLTNTLYEKLGWKATDNHLDDLLRTTVIGLACHSGNKECLSDAAELFQNWTRGQKIPSSLKSLVYHYGMLEIGQEEHWNYMWNKYLSEDSSSESKTLLYGLSHVRVPTLIHRYLEYVMDDKKIRRQDFFTALNYIAENPIGRPFVWKFLREKWTTLVERFAINNRQLELAVKKICSYFTMDYELKQVKDFFSKHSDAGAGNRRLQQALEIVQNNINWLKTYKESVKIWLQMESPWYYHRLPAYIVPEHYDLTFFLVLEDDIFHGTAAITVSLNKPTDCFLVHAVALNITIAEIRHHVDDKIMEIEDTFYYPENDYFVLKFWKKLPIGKYKLFFEFAGPFTVSLKGLYKSSYVDPDTMEKRYLAVTHFAPIAARRAFPCFDEPSFKSTFSVRIVHDSDHFALSNTGVKDVVVLEDGLIGTRFEDTLPMSTYLLCIVVCDFKYKETITENGVTFRVYAAPHLLDKVDYALSVESRLLTYFETYFDYRFPLKKLDMIAVPDFVVAGMENWGLITYIEETLLSASDSSVTAKYDTAKTVAHELAHMWFGDLVTMNWWDDLWLKEGFATYMSLKAMQRVAPEFDTDDSSASLLMTRAMRSDQTINSHPIVQKVLDVKSGIYDSIIYQKGASVLMMLENYMGEDFRKGVNTYLKKYAFSSVKTGDLWTELTVVSTRGLNVALIMDTWTKQMNYPYLSVTQEPGEDGRYTVQQHRFLEDPSSMDYSAHVSPFNYIWQIPITYRTSDTKEVQNLLMNSSDAALEVPKSRWIKLNVNFTGIYSVNYDVGDWKLFSHILKENHEEFSPSDRVNLLFDSFSLANAGHLVYGIPLNMTLYLRKETDYGAWKTALKSLNYIQRFFRNNRMKDTTKAVIKEYIRSLTKDLFKRYNWTSNVKDYSMNKLRLTVIEAACDNGNHGCLVTAGDLFANWMKGIPLDPEVSNLVYIYGLRFLQTKESWNFLWEKCANETDPYQKSYMLHALTYMREPTFIESLIEAARNESFVRKHEYLWLLHAIAENELGFSQVASIIFNNWTDIVKKYGSHAAESSAYAVFKLYDTEKDLNKVRDFYTKHKVTKEGEKYRTLAIEKIMKNIRWRRMHKTSVMEWFENNVFMPWRHIRLPRHILPTKYDIILSPNITGKTFVGVEEISISILEPTIYILVHSLKLEILNVELISLASGDAIPIEEHFPYRMNNFHVIISEEMIPTGEYILKLNFTGVVYDYSRGLGRYQYTKEDSSTGYVLATKFEPTDARSVFPCFDEPDMKAVFKLSLIHEENYTALSNMPVESTTPLAENMIQTVFQDSVKMSTYLLCFVIGELDYIEGDYKGKKVRAYSQPRDIPHAEYGLNLTIKFLAAYEEYFDIPYALPKLDSVAIPMYVSTAMEHWGIVTYNEPHFLVFDDDPPFQRIPRVDKVIAHELAHQWFGNLVTMKWWNDLWLNEGLASFIMYLPLQQYYPETDQLQAKKISKAMCIDTTKGGNPIIPKEKVSDTSDIKVLFSSFIIYRKGGAVLNMLQYILKDDLRKGISNYLKKYAFKNAVGKDFWEELSDASSLDLNITEIMNTWTLQMGFPYVEIKRKGGILEATQRWFIKNESDSSVTLLAQEKELSPFGFIWKIPLIYKNLATGIEETLWLNERNATFSITAMQNDILIFNPGFVGYYIVKYDENDYQRIAKRLKENHTIFSTVDRYVLLRDAFSLAGSDRLLYDIPLEFTKYLKNEKEVLPWIIFRERFDHILKMVDKKSETEKLLKKYVRYLTADLYEELVWSKNDTKCFKFHEKFINDVCELFSEDIDMGPTIAYLACHSGNEKCITTMNEELQLWIQGENITVDLDVVLSTAIPHTENSMLWDIIYEKSTDSNATDIWIMQYLGAFTGRQEIMKTIDVMMRDPSVNSDMAQTIFKKLANNAVAHPILWNYAKANWESLVERTDKREVISILCEEFKTLRNLGDFTRFIKTIPPMDDYSAYVLRDCIERIQYIVNWSEKYERTIESWLRWNTP